MTSQHQSEWYLLSLAVHNLLCKLNFALAGHVAFAKIKNIAQLIAE